MSTRVRLDDLVTEYSKVGREAFVEKYAGVAAFRGIGKVKDLSEEEEFEGRTMMVAVGADSPYENGTMTQVIETEPGSCTDVVWLIPNTARLMTLGRNASAEISVPEYSVSAEHGVLQWKKGAGLTILDSAASHGIWIASDGIERLAQGEQYIFEGEEQVLLGRFVFSFHYFESLMIQVAHLAAIKKEMLKRAGKSGKSKRSKAARGGFFKRFFGG